jgi:hypothetical protein
MTIYALNVTKNPVITKNVGSNTVDLLAGLSNNAADDW